MKTLELAKAFVVEAMLFQKPNDGSVIPNWMIGVLAWGNIAVILLCIIK